MPAWSRQSGVFTECVPRGRVGGALTSDESQLWARVAGAWELIYPEPSAGGLLPVENMAVASVTHNEVEVTWDLPDQEVAPTEVQIRVPDISGIWMIYDYPQVNFIHSALDGNTSYQVQVRLVRREDGVAVATSATRSVFFTTTADPIGNPGEDPGGIGNPLDPPDDPGPIGGPGCWFEWKLQILDQDTLAWVDTGIDGFLPGTDTSVVIDPADLDPTRVYRVAVREICDGVPGDWTYGEPFPGLGDWGAECGGIAGNESANLTVVGDAIWAIPRMCLAAEAEPRIAIFDAVSGLEVQPGPAFGSQYRDTGGDWGVVNDTSGVALVAGLPAIDSAFVPGGDWSISVDVGFGPNHSPLTGTRAILTIGFSHRLELVYTSTTWKPRMRVLTDAGYVTIEGTARAYSTRYSTVSFVWDDGGTKTLYVNGIVDGSDATATDPLVEPASIGWTAVLDGGAYARKYFGWDRALTQSEVLTLYNPVYAVSWQHLWWVEGEAFEALGLAPLDPVTTWPDEIGSLDLTLVGSLAPEYHEDGYRIHGPVVNVSRLLHHLASATLGSPIPQPFSIVILAVQPRGATMTTSRTLFDRNNTSTNRWRLQRTVSTTNMNLTGTSGNFSATSAMVEDAPTVWAIVANGASSKILKDGTVIATGNAGTGNFDSFTLGAQGAGDAEADLWVVLAGVVAGDVELLNGWDELLSWADSTYGLGDTAHTAPYFDNLRGAQTSSNNWIHVAGGSVGYGSGVISVTLSGTHHGYLGFALNTDHYGEYKNLAPLSGNNGPLVRAAAASAGAGASAVQGYTLRYINSTTLAIQEVAAGVATTLASVTVSTIDNVTPRWMRLEAEGSTLRGYVKLAPNDPWTLMLTTSDSTYTGTRAGYFGVMSGANVSILTNFAAGNL